MPPTWNSGILVESIAHLVSALSLRKGHGCTSAMAGSPPSPEICVVAEALDQVNCAHTNGVLIGIPEEDRVTVLLALRVKEVVSGQSGVAAMATHVAQPGGMWGTAEWAPTSHHVWPPRREGLNPRRSPRRCMVSFSDHGRRRLIEACRGFPAAAAVEEVTALLPCPLAVVGQYGSREALQDAERCMGETSPSGGSLLLAQVAEGGVTWYATSVGGSASRRRPTQASTALAETSAVGALHERWLPVRCVLRTDVHAVHAPGDIAALEAALTAPSTSYVVEEMEETTAEGGEGDAPRHVVSLAGDAALPHTPWAQPLHLQPYMSLQAGRSADCCAPSIAVSGTGGAAGDGGAERVTLDLDVVGYAAHGMSARQAVTEVFSGGPLAEWGAAGGGGEERE